MQKRLPKFKRAPEAIGNKPITERDILIIETVGRFRFLASSDIIRLVGGNEDVTYRHLQQLYHRDLLSRIALPKNGGYGEFIYFLDNSAGLRELVRRSKLDASALDWKEIKFYEPNDRLFDHTGCKVDPPRTVLLIRSN